MEYLQVLVNGLLLLSLSVLSCRYVAAYPSPIDNHFLMDYGYGRSGMDAMQSDQVPFLEDTDYGAEMKSKRARFGKRPKGGSWEDVLQELSRGDRNLDFSRLKSIRFGLGGRR